MADAPVLDLEKYPNARAFVAKCHEFFKEVKNLTPGHELEARLNATHGPGTPYYDAFRSFILAGLKEGWVAQTELDGPRYRRGRIAAPTPESNFISITTVYMSSEGEGDDASAIATAGDEEYRGQYHAHPYGEINCVILLDENSKAQLKGMQGWQGAGWTSPGPGTHHYPEVRNGELVALFFLPAGRISYEATPGMAQPASL
ncbi:hypothetical protein G647_04477 [Cladophialophora carrionii CBS 160.54]|uniref:p-hydroxylaminobenzoate lyase n=1 Tax=Cladophialophora carrionii CBS 160.54 TaxID=1279043 RepID=V9DEJ5_9EURO|nr:uncharacterized protein G647_04477 [Cladophialophora carrionii CBS 160.54]ETI25106.1 hypothetical protein G647_04477 [Cladophialophora carrionii CBS 160.54]